MCRDVFVAGVGMIPFTKPGANEPYPQMAAKATRAALKEAGVEAIFGPGTTIEEIVAFIKDALKKDGDD